MSTYYLQHRSYRFASTMGIIILLSSVPLLLWLAFSASSLKLLSGSDFFVVHILTEVFAIIVSALIFFIAYSSHRRLHSASVIVLGCAFLAAVLFNVFHFLSYPAMSDFVTENNTNKAILFWLFGRFAVGLGLLLYVLLAASWFRLVLRPGSALVATLLVVTSVSYLILYAPELFPVMFVKDSGLTTANVFIEWLGFSIHVGTAAILYWQRGRIVGCDVSSLLLALLLMAVGELFFAVYIQVNDVATLIGHIYKVIGLFYLYTAIFSEVITRPLEQMRKILSHDELTGLASRAEFSSQLTNTIEYCAKTDKQSAVILLGLDHFKNENATLGHDVGDLLLLSVAERIKRMTPASSCVARLSGDIFGILLKQDNLQGAIQMADALTVAIKQPFDLGQNVLETSASMGIVVYPEDGDSACELLRHADTAMYQAKDEGKCCYRRFSPEMEASICRRVDISNRLRQACDVLDEQFSLHYQPRVELATGKICGVEALLRWKPLATGFVSPEDFIPIAEANGSIIPIGKWVLETACQQAKEWQDSLGVAIPVAVNLSVRQFRDIRDFAYFINDVLKRTGLVAEMLELELTESMLMNNTQEMIQTLFAFKEKGMRLAIDDFGTGYSSLSYLKEFPLDYLKVDRYFVSNIEINENDRSIVRAIIDVAHNLGLRVIAEGVENHEQLDFMLSQDCDEIQGYYFSKPLIPARMTDLLKSGQDLYSIISK